MQAGRPKQGSRQKAERAGRIAECASSIIAILSGWRILYRRHKTPFGEIDLVCRRGNTLLCIEVKYRKTITDITTALPSPAQQQRLAKATEYLFAHINSSDKHTDDLSLRFDIHIWTGRGRLMRRSYVALENTSWHFE